MTLRRYQHEVRRVSYGIIERLCQLVKTGFKSLWRKSLVAGLIAVSVSATALPPAHAQRNLPIVRDAEIEALLNDYVVPLLKVAGIRRNRVDVVLVNAKSFNAFVSGTKIFVNLGAIVDSDTPNELIGVLAHEIGHLAGGHQDRLRQQLDRAQTIAVVSSILGAATVIAAASQRNGAGARAGAGIAMGGTELAQRGLFAYQRTEELAADRAAVDYLNATKQSSKGILKTFERFHKDLSLVRDRINPYRLSHPLPRERIAALEILAQQSPYFNKQDASSLQVRHDKARAKILAYTYGPNAAESAFSNARGSVAHQYGQAISTFLYRNPRNAIPMIDKLIRSSPNNAYYHEIKGEIMLQAQDAKGAVKAFSDAVRIDGARSPTMMVGLGHALVLSGSKDDLRRAVGELEVAISLDPANSNAHRHLAMAYGRLGDTGSADLATAEAQFYAGQYKSAKQFAARAKRAFPKNAPQWLRADDILRFKNPKS